MAEIRHNCRMNTPRVKAVQGKLHKICGDLGKYRGWTGREVRIYLRRIVEGAAPIALLVLSIARKELGEQFNNQGVIDLVSALGDDAAELEYLEALPDDHVVRIEAFLDDIIRDKLPEIKAALQGFAAPLDQRQNGGAKARKWPDEATCNRICRRLRGLQQQDVPMETAKRTVAGSFDLSLRMIERIWHDRKKYE
jgi:hypothetical protein